MRHRKKTNHLSRTASHRKAMLSNMATSLIMHKRIKTTVAKAKALRMYVEPIISKSKEDTTHNRRLVFKHLQNKYAVSELFSTVAPKIAERPGGYTRILKLGHRMGDNAEICIIELVDFNVTYNPNGGAKKSKKRRTRRSGGAKKVENTANVVKDKVKEVVEETKNETNESTEVKE